MEEVEKLLSRKDRRERRTGDIEDSDEDSDEDFEVEQFRVKNQSNLSKILRSPLVSQRFFRQSFSQNFSASSGQVKSEASTPRSTPEINGHGGNQNSESGSVKTQEIPDFNLTYRDLTWKNQPLRAKDLQPNKHQSLWTQSPPSANIGPGGTTTLGKNTSQCSQNTSQSAQSSNSGPNSTQNLNFANSSAQNQGQGQGQPQPQSQGQPQPQGQNLKTFVNNGLSDVPLLHSHQSIWCKHADPQDQQICRVHITGVDLKKGTISLHWRDIETLCDGEIDLETGEMSGIVRQLQHNQVL